jgi:hypothetical protein
MVLFPNSTSINISNLITYKELIFSSFKFADIKLPSENELFKYFFKSKRYGKPASKSRYKTGSTFTGTFKEIVQPERQSNIYYVKGVFKRKLIKQAYLRYVNNHYNIVSKRDVIEELVDKGEDGLEALNYRFGTTMTSMYDNNGELAPELLLILDLQAEYMEILVNNSTDYDAIEIPEDFIEERKRGKEVLVDTDILLTLSNYRNKTTINTKKLHKHTGMIFWGTRDDREKLEAQRKVYELLFGESTWTNSRYNTTLALSTLESSPGLLSSFHN